MNGIRWPLVVLFSALLASGGLLAVWSPVWKHEAELREQALAAAREFDGAQMAPCNDTQRSFVRDVFPESEDEGSDFSIVIMPAFSDAWRVSVTGTRVTVVQQWHRHSSNRAWAAPIGPAVRLEGRAELSPPHAKALSALMRQRIGNAYDTPRGGFDGASFVFQSGEACAATWEPDGGSGAERLVRIGGLLAYQASIADPKQQARVEQHLVPFLRSFEHRGGSDVAAFMDEDAIQREFGPEWSEAARQRSAAYKD